MDIENSKNIQDNMPIGDINLQKAEEGNFVKNNKDAIFSHLKDVNKEIDIFYSKKLVFSQKNIKIN